MAAGIFTHPMMAGTALTGRTVTPMDSSSSGGNSTNDANSDSVTITANDFLTLLVTEMQNQDPTADTDPDEYIDQLVQVNSLEQLININQTLTTDLGAPSTSTGGNAASSTAAPAAPSLNGTGAAGDESSALRVTHLAGKPGSSPARATPGNLSIPSASAASQQVAHALEQPSHAKPIAGRLSAFEATSLNNRP